jgi:hypothetical protein
MTIEYPEPWPAGRARFYCDIIKSASTVSTDDMDTAMMIRSAGAYIFVSCTYIQKSDSLLMIWSSNG